MVLSLHPHLLELGIRDHVDGTVDATTMFHDIEWMSINPIVVSWLCTPVSPEILDMVLTLDSSVHDVWVGIYNVFRDNHIKRLVLLQQELCGLYQNDISIHEYATRLKLLVDKLLKVGSPVDLDMSSPAWPKITRPR